MKNYTVIKLLLVLLILSLTGSVCEAQGYKRSVRNPERGLFGKSINNKTVKYKEAPSIVRAKKKQAANQEKLKKEYNENLKQNRKRALEIQSPEVRERMIGNRKESDQKYREKKKKNEKLSKRAAKKRR